MTYLVMNTCPNFLLRACCAIICTKLVIFLMSYISNKDHKINHYEKHCHEEYDFRFILSHSQLRLSTNILDIISFLPYSYQFCDYQTAMFIFRTWRFFRAEHCVRMIKLISNKEWDDNIFVRYRYKRCFIDMLIFFMWNNCAVQ